MSSKSRNVIVLGSRASRLAQAQTEEAARIIAKHNPSLSIQRKTFSTSGDQNRDQPVQNIGVGVFVKQIENALSSGEIDIAVHSLKDMPLKSPSDLTIAAVTYREDPRDALINTTGQTLQQLPSGSVVATGSLRRRALIHSMRHDLILHPIRGNVTTRLKMLDDESHEIDALVLAAAGLKRLGLEHRVSAYLGCMTFVSAPGQGALALQTRRDDEFAINLCQTVEHTETRQCVDAERALLAHLGGGCASPIGAHARIDDDTITISAFVSDQAGVHVFKHTDDAPRDQANLLARNIATKLIDDGAMSVIDLRDSHSA